MKLWTGIIICKVQASKAFCASFFNAESVCEGEGGGFVQLRIGESIG